MVSVGPPDISPPIGRARPHAYGPLQLQAKRGFPCAGIARNRARVARGSSDGTRSRLQLRSETETPALDYRSHLTAHQNEARRDRTGGGT